MVTEVQQPIPMGLQREIAEMMRRHPTGQVVLNWNERGIQTRVFNNLAGRVPEE